MEYLTVSLLGAEQPGLINEITKLVSHCNCNLVECRFTILGSEFIANLLLAGTWNAVAKFEASLAGFEHKHEIRSISRRTQLHEGQPDKLPYTAYIIAPDKSGTLYKLTQFLAEQNIPIHDMFVNSYKAPFSETAMCSITLSFTLPIKKNIADIRETFMVFCDEHNYDAVMEPQKN